MHPHNSDASPTARKLAEPQKVEALVDGLICSHHAPASLSDRQGVAHTQQAPQLSAGDPKALLTGEAVGTLKIDKEDELIWMGDDPHYSPFITHPSPARLSPIPIGTGKSAQTSPVPGNTSQFSRASPTSLIYFHHKPSCTTISHSSSVSQSSHSASSSPTATISYARLAPKRVKPMLMKLKIGASSPVLRGTEGFELDSRSLSPAQSKSGSAPTFDRAQTGARGPHDEAEQLFSPRTPFTPLLTPHTPSMSGHPFLAQPKDGTAFQHQQSMTGAGIIRADSPMRLMVDDVERALEVDHGTFGQKSSLQELIERTGRVARIIRRGST